MGNSFTKMCLKIVTDNLQAFAAASVMSDRICIESEGKTKVNLSAEDLMACCPTCSPHDYGCQKGDPLEAFKFWVKTGLVTGGPHHFRKTVQTPIFQCFTINVFHFLRVADLTLVRRIIGGRTPIACSTALTKSTSLVTKATSTKVTLTTQLRGILFRYDSIS
jgi:hypothetical protein